MADNRNQPDAELTDELEQDQQIPTTDSLARNPGGVVVGRQDPVPGCPDDGIASTYTAGNNTAGLKPGGASAADVTGGGAGGDIDNPDITGRGSLEDIARGTDVQSCPRPPDRPRSRQ